MRHVPVVAVAVVVAEVGGGQLENCTELGPQGSQGGSDGTERQLGVGIKD